MTGPSIGVIFLKFSIDWGAALASTIDGSRASLGDVLRGQNSPVVVRRLVGIGERREQSPARRVHRHRRVGVIDDRVEVRVLRDEHVPSRSVARNPREVGGRLERRAPRREVIAWGEVTATGVPGSSGVDERRLVDAPEVREVTEDVVRALVPIRPRTHADAIRRGRLRVWLVRLRQLGLLRRPEAVGRIRRVALVQAQRRPSGDGGDVRPSLRPVAVPLTERRHLHGVARRSGNRIPHDERARGRRARGDVAVVVAHVEARDGRPAEGCGAIEDLLERAGRPGRAPDSCVPVGIDRPNTPVVGVVAEDLRRRERRAHDGLGAAHLRPGCPVVGRVDLDLVARRPRHRVPHELRIEGLRLRPKVSQRHLRRGRPAPAERGARGLVAAVPLPVERRHAPVVSLGAPVGSRGGREVDAVARGRRLRRAIADERVTVLIGRRPSAVLAVVRAERDEVARRTGHRLPPHRQRRLGELDRCALGGPDEPDRRRPILHDRARAGPVGDGAGLGERADAPPVPSVRKRPRDRRARVAGDDSVGVGLEVRVGRELELVLLSTADGSPRERGEVLYLRAVPGRDRCRDGRSSPSAARRDERGRARDGRDRRSDAEPRPQVPGPLLRRGPTSDQIVRRSPVKLHPGTSRTRPAFWQAGRRRSTDLLGSPARTTPQSRQVAPGGSTYSHGVPPGEPDRIRLRVP